jgi:hypothetical protein
MVLLSTWNTLCTFMCAGNNGIAERSQLVRATSGPRSWWWRMQNLHRRICACGSSSRTGQCTGAVILLLCTRPCGLLTRKHGLLAAAEVGIGKHCKYVRDL